MIHAIQQVLRFELERAITRGRIAMWTAIAIFPALLMFLMQTQVQGRLPAEPLVIMATYLVAQFGCMLGLLLWATPAVGAELEAQTWTYLALRPQGRIALVLGKYLVAVAFSISSGLISSLGVAFFSRYQDVWTLAAVLCALVVISSLCYGALYLLIGIVWSKRATVFAVVYSLIIEGAISYVPAAINKLTVCYRIQSLLAEWSGLVRLQENRERLVGSEPVWQHLTGVALFVTLCLVVSIVVVQNKEFPGQGED
ncbi:MAG: ABC transporter permease [Planctomycetales bacterium]|nr:ABC transporter permease [Planctomycetales bacterium]